MEVTGKSLSRLIRVYDAGFRDRFHQDLFEDSGFSNFGYWESGNKNSVAASRRLVEFVAQRIPLSSGPQLDVACGEGGTSAALSALHPTNPIYGINISEKQVTAARARVPQGKFDVMDACALAFPDEMFAGVYCFEAAFHFRTRETFLSETFRVLKPGGAIGFTDIIFRVRAPEDMVPAANHLKSTADYAALLEEVGFRDVTVTDITAQSWKTFRKRLLGFAWRRFIERRGRAASLRDLWRSLDRVWKYDLAFKNYIAVTARKP